MGHEDARPPGASSASCRNLKVRYLIFDAFGFGGTVRAVLSVANYLAGRNYDVEIISIMRWREKPVFSIDPRITIRVLNDTGNWKPRRWLNWRLLATAGARLLTRSSLIHPDDEAYGLFSRLTDARLLRYFKRIASGVLITTRASLNLFAARHVAPSVIKVGQEHLPSQRYTQRLRRDIRDKYPQLDALVTLTESDRNEYAKMLGDAPACLLTVPNPVPQMLPRQATPDQKVLVAAGRFVPQKGFDLLIEAFARVAVRRPDWTLKIFGNGPDREKLQQMIEDRGLRGRALLMEASTTIEEEFAQASVYVLSSRFEGFPMVVLEAMGCGLPVVGFDCPTGPRDIIRHGEDGLLVERENVAALAESLLGLMEDPEKRKRLGARARASVQRFAIEVIGPRWVELIEALSRSKGVAASQHGAAGK